MAVLCCVVLCIFQTLRCMPCGCTMRLQWYCHRASEAEVLLQLVVLRCRCDDPFLRGRAAPSWLECVVAMCAACFCVALLLTLILFPCQSWIMSRSAGLQQLQCGSNVAAAHARTQGLLSMHRPSPLRRT